MGKMTHFHIRMPIQPDGYIHLGNGDVIAPGVLAEGLAKSKGVERGTLKIDHQKDEVRWAQHLTTELAEAMDELHKNGMSASSIAEKYFIPPACGQKNG